MIDPTRPQGVIAYERLSMRYTLEIAHARLALFHLWADHLGLTEAGLAARIFNEGTIQFGLMSMDDSSPLDSEDEVRKLAVGVLDDLECHLDALPITKEGQHAADHN